MKAIKLQKKTLLVHCLTNQSYEACYSCKAIYSLGTFVFKKREWCPLINGDDFIKHVTYKNCFYLHYSLRWSCDLGNSVIPAPRYHTNGALQAMATRNVCISLKT